MGDPSGHGETNPHGEIETGAETEGFIEILKVSRRRARNRPPAVDIAARSI